MFKYCCGTQGKQVVEYYRKHKLHERGGITSPKQKTPQCGLGGRKFWHRTRSARDISHLTGHVCEGKNRAVILYGFKFMYLCKLY